MGIAGDLRYALRALRFAPVFFSALVLILTLGIGATVSVFSIVDGVLLRPLPYAHPERLALLTSVAADPKFDSNGSLPYADFEAMQARCRSFEDLAVTYRTGWSRVTLTGGEEPQSVQGAFVSPNLFTLFGRAPLLGRTFTVDEDRRGARVVVVSEPLARARYGSAANAIGKDIEMGGAPWTIIGVMPGDFRVPFLGTRLWMPIHAHPEWNDRGETDPQLRQRWDVVARLRPGVRLAAAQAEVDGLETQLRAALPEYHNDFRVRVVPLRESFTGAVAGQLWILFGSVSFLLLIACVNAGNLLLSRAASRQREFAVRAALGGARLRLIRQLVCESVVVCGIAGMLGAGLGAALLPVLKAAAPPNIPRLDGVSLDIRVLLFAAGVSLLTGIVLGIAPAWNASRRDLSDSLQGSSRAIGGDRTSARAKRILVVAEFAAAMVLLTGAGLLIRSFIAVLDVNPGFHPEHVLTVRVGLPNDASPTRAARFYDQVMERIAGLPGVTAVGGVSNLFFLDEKRTHALRHVEGRPPEPRSAWTPLVWTQVSGNYFQAMGIRLLRGRYFDASDRPGAPLAAIINETLAHRYWPGEDPTGKRFKGFDPRGRNDDWLTVVGVVQDMHSGGLERAPLAQVYEVQSQRGEQIGNLVVRATGEASQVARSVRSIIRAADPAALVPGIATMTELLADQESDRRFQTWLIAVFSGMALLLAAFGVFAVMHYAVASRTHEIAVRMAVGARAGNIIALVLREGVRLAITGIAAGCIVAAWASTGLASMLYGVAPQDPVTYAAAGAALVAVALAACVYPARRASAVDPMNALRSN